MTREGVSLPCVTDNCDFTTTSLEYNQSHEQLLTHLEFNHAAGSGVHQETSVRIQSLLDIIHQGDQEIMDILSRRNDNIQEIIKAAEAEESDTTNIQNNPANITSEPDGMEDIPGVPGADLSLIHI